MTNTCSDCGANLAIVGRVHRCVPRQSEVSGNTGERHRGQAGGVPRAEHRTQLQGRNQVAAEDRTPDTAADGNPKQVLEKPLGTYKYRDPDKWRAYMAGYMKQRRARQRGVR